MNARIRFSCDQSSADDAVTVTTAVIDALRLLGFEMTELGNGTDWMEISVQSPARSPAGDSFVPDWPKYSEIESSMDDTVKVPPRLPAMFFRSKVLGHIYETMYYLHSCEQANWEHIIAERRHRALNDLDRICRTMWDVFQRQ